MKRTARIIVQSIRAISRNKGRSFLTSLGIIIGIASVIALLAIAQGAQGSITSQISSNGTKAITVNSGAAMSFGGGGPMGGPGGTTQSTEKQTLTTSDLEDLKKNSSKYKITDISAYVSDTQELTLKEKDTDGNDQTQEYTVIGAEPGYFTVEDVNIDKGRSFTAQEVTDSAKVVVLGSQAAEDLFGSDDPIGETITLKDDTYKIIGVAKEKNQSGFTNPNSALYAPYTSIISSFSKENLSSIYMNATSEDSVDSAKTAVEKELLDNHDKTTKTQDFSISTQKDLLETVTATTDVFKMVLGGIAGISLLVGGIGIMNIMLVAATERTKEIGLRKALGARMGDIMLQFLVESILLCLIGGLAGVALGMGIAELASGISLGGSSFNAVVTTSSIILAVGVSTIVGLIFGLYPAAKAARKNAIDALRYE